VNFDLTDEQRVVSDLAAQIFAGSAPTERVKQVEASGDVDRQLWRQLADANLVGLCLPNEHGGSDMGPVELALVLEQQGRHVAPVPVLATVVAAMAVAELGSPTLAASLLPAVVAGDCILTTALAEAGANDVLRPSVNATPVGAGFRITGAKPSVPVAHLAQRILVPASRSDGSTLVAIVDPATSGVTLTPVATTDREPQAHLELDVVVDVDDVVQHPDAISWIYERTLVGLAALQLGVAQGALWLTAGHVASREQFGRPLSSFQAVSQRAADGYITTEALRVTTLNAAWRLAEGFDARRDVLVAAFWASDGAQDIVLAAQHLHGGIGADVDYPVHRYFLWGSQLANALGTASSYLARLGRLLATT
jgi:acyl-CoA dehydrogenase